MTTVAFTGTRRHGQPGAEASGGIASLASPWRACQVMIATQRLPGTAGMVVADLMMGR
jgi:hypothetical protein